ncbi:MAG: DNA-processing protein DprA [Gemmatimonadales bacterium]|nr:DNA-processing protein DprA [Gemmatimonadales bacterium]
MTRPTGPIPSATTLPTNDAEERLAYLALALVDGLGARRLAALLSQCGSATAVLAASPTQLAETPGLSREVRSAIRRARLEEAERHLARCAQLGQQLLTPACDAYPASLRSIPDPPIALWVRGRVDLLTRPAVAIVGSRDHSAYGEDVARRVAREAARAGIAVVSGMARGLDAVAHEAALAAHGATIGVLGTGADVVYPQQNWRLFQDVLDHGLLVSELPPGSRPHAGAFPRRNRLISGLTQVTVIVEAAEGSGTMLTCASALEQGREVLVVPGPITSRTSCGTNRLLAEGATPLLTPADILSHFGAATPPRDPALVDPPTCTLSPTEARVFAALADTGRHIDELALAVGLPVGEMLATLLGLEIGGLAQSLPGGQYRRGARR